MAKFDADAWFAGLESKKTTVVVPHPTKKGESFKFALVGHADAVTAESLAKLATAQADKTTVSKTKQKTAGGIAKTDSGKATGDQLAEIIKKSEDARTNGAK
jgi:hypothetical protein